MIRYSSRLTDSFYALFVAVVLNIAYILSYLDRHILALLIEPIRVDLGLSDTEVSLLTGFAYIAGYSVLLVPMGYLADSYNRKYIIMTGVVSWSAFTASCGAMMSFINLFFARVGVGLGEAMLLPAAYSILGDYFSKPKLQKAMSIFVLGAPLGGALALIVGGAVIDWVSTFLPISIPGVGDIKAWQAVFIIIGFLGVFVVMLLSFVVEPKRKDMMRIEGVVARKVPSSIVRAFLQERKKLFVPLVAGLALTNITAFGALTWLPTLFMRVYGWTAAEAGVRIGVVSLIFGVIGPFLALKLSNYFLKKNDHYATIKVALIGTLILCPGAIGGPLMSDAWVALSFVSFIILGVYTISGIVPTLIQNISPNQMRGKISSFVVLIINLLGIGLGPTLVALCTDYWFEDEQALGKSMALVFGITMTVGITLMYQAVKPYGIAVLKAKAWEDVAEE